MDGAADCSLAPPNPAKAGDAGLTAASVPAGAAAELAAGAPNLRFRAGEPAAAGPAKAKPDLLVEAGAAATVAAVAGACVADESVAADACGAALGAVCQLAAKFSLAGPVSAAVPAAAGVAAGTAPAEALSAGVSLGAVVEPASFDSRGVMRRTCSKSAEPANDTFLSYGPRGEKKKASEAQGFQIKQIE